MGVSWSRSSRPSSSTLACRVTARRIASTPRRRATSISQAPGLSGTPDAGHCSSAATRASWARSSASPTSRTTRARPAISLADSIRQTASIARSVAALTTPDGGLLAGPLLGRRDVGREGSAEVIHVQDLAQLDLAAQRRALGPLHGLVHRGDLPDRVAGDQLLGLGERTVEHPGRAVGVEADPLGLARAAAARRRPAARRPGAAPACTDPSPRTPRASRIRRPPTARSPCPGP